MNAELCEWAKGLPGWEQVAFDRILEGMSFANGALDELVDYLLEDAGLKAKSAPRPPLTHILAGDLADGPVSVKTRLISLSSLKNVNALPEGQRLTFGPGLTIAFGANGSGKSGYARVLGCVGFTRGDRQVLPNVDVAQPVNPLQTAAIELDDGSQAGPRTVTFDAGKPSPLLRAFYVFDSTSVAVHLSGTNAFSFAPAGLGHLTRLADVIDDVRRRLERRIAALRVPLRVTSLFSGTSGVASYLATLSANSDLNKLRHLAAMTDKDRERRGVLQTMIAERKTRDLRGLLSVLKQSVADIERLAEAVVRLEGSLADSKASELQRELDLHITVQAAARLATGAQFQTDSIQGVGSAEWVAFVQSARALANRQASGEKYPADGASCILCQQPLATDARGLLSRIWAFVDDQARSDLAKTEGRLAALETELLSTETSFLTDKSVVYRHLQERDSALLSRLLQFVNSCRARRDDLLAAIGSRRWKPPHTLSNSCTDDIRRLLDELKSEARSSEAEGNQDDTIELEEELRNLDDRELLSSHVAEVETHVRSLEWADRAAALSCNTRHVTLKYNEVFTRLVTERYLQLFQETLAALRRPLHVEVKTSGRKGETFKEIILHTAAPTAEMTPPEKVLSEGEKRAVAIADFLTEVTLDTTSAGIILDDPVTSFDLEWRSTMAQILAKEASSRQVIVFTHDLPFVYYLKEAAEAAAVVTETHWIKRGANDRPGYVFLNNSPALEREYRKPKRARELCLKAKDAGASEQEALLREGFGALRTSYEAFIIFELFNEVVMRFHERISFGRLKEIVWDKSIADEVIEKCEALSKYIEGHLHSDALMAAKPTPQLLLTEIEAYESLARKLKQLKQQGPKET